MNRTINATLFFVALVIIWQLAVSSGRWSPVLLPGPRSVAEYLWGALVDGSLRESCWVTASASCSGCRSEC
jgi:NitT/TauT family transport system permease protein